MTIRILAPSVLALIVGLALLAPTPVFGQHTRVLFGSDHGIWIPATDQQLIRVTIGNPNRPDPAGDGHFRESSFSIELDGPAVPVTIGPGESFTYTLDPCEVGVLVDPNTGQRHVRVSARVTAVAIDPSDPSGPHPVFLVEILNRKTGKLESFHSFPGFSGGVRVAV
jgi:hypothetical protein